jgi:hypothetical protein
MMLISTTSLTPYPIVGMTKRKLILTCLLAAISWRPAGAVDLTVSNTSKEVSVTNSLPWAVAQINSQAQSSNTITFEGALDIELDNPLVLEYPVSFQTDATLELSVASEGDATVMMADGSLTVTGDLGGNLAASSSGGSASGMVAGGPVSIGSMSGEVEVSGAIEGLGIVSEDAVIISGGIIDGDANYETLNFDISGGQFAAGIGADNRVEIGGFDGSMNVESSSGPAVGMFSFRELELDGNLTGSVSVTGGADAVAIGAVSFFEDLLQNSEEPQQNVAAVPEKGSVLVTGNIDADLSATSNGGNAAAVVIGSDGDITVNGMIGGFDDCCLG